MNIVSITNNTTKPQVSLSDYENLYDLVGHYVHTDTTPTRYGRVKAPHHSREDALWVVFDCKGQWMEIDNYPAELWGIKDLKDGWKDKLEGTYL